MVESRQQLVIHSGAYKTATSAVQMILNKNADMLLREHGILVPRTFSRPLQGVEGEEARSHNQLGHVVNKFRRGEDGAEEKLHAGLARLADEIRASGSPRAVISTEMLTGIDERSAAAIRDSLREFELRVVYSVRRVDEYFESIARQRLKFKNVTQKVKPPCETPFTGLLSWAKVLGDAALNVLVYGHPSRRTAVFDILLAFGIEDTAGLVGDNPVRNPSLQADGLLLRRALTRFATEIGYDVTSSGLREPIVRRAYRLEARLQRPKPLLVYGKAERLAIFDATLPSHEEIARRFLSPEQSEIFLARSAIEALDEWEPARWEASEVLSVVDELANFALEHLSTIGPQDQALDHLRKEFRVARRRNAQLRDRIKQLEAQLGADTPPEEVE
jgi:hypothetical protein